MGRKEKEQKIYSPYFSRRKKKEKNKGRGFLFFTSRPLGRQEEAFLFHEMRPS